MRRWLPFALLIALAACGAWFVLQRGPSSGPVPDAERPAASRASEAEVSTLETLASARAPEAVAPSSANTARAAACELLVRVLREHSRAPVADASVTVFEPGAAQDPASNRLDLRPVFGSSNTDASGECRVQVPCDVALGISARIPRREQHERHQFARCLAGEPAACEVLLPEEDDSRVFGIVLAAESSAPIAGARIELRAGESRDRLDASATSGRDGRFELAFTSWAQPHLVVEAEGFGLRLADPAGHSDPARPLRIELERCAELQVVVQGGAGRPLEGVQLALVTRGAELGLGAAGGFFMHDIPPAGERSWKETSDAQGRARFAGLPAHATLRLSARAPDDRPRCEALPLALEPGERRTQLLVLGRGTLVRGRLVDQFGAVLAQRQLFLASAPDPEQRTLLTDPGAIRQRVTTDERGAFAFAPVSAGDWVVGLRFRLEGDEIGMPPRALTTSGEGEQSIELCATRGLGLEGRVVDERGLPVSNALVEAYAEGEWYWSEARSADDGRFRIAPVTDQELTLLARATGFAFSAPVRARAGGAPSELRLVRGRLLRGRVIDAASGAGVRAQVLCAPEQRGYGPFGLGSMLETDDEGRFEFGSLAPGRHGLAALDADGRSAVRTGIPDGAEEFVLALEPGARLELRHCGARRLWARVRSGGVPVHFGARLEPGDTRTLLAPAGSIVLELREDPLGEPRTRELALSAGQTLALDVRE